MVTSKGSPKQYIAWILIAAVAVFGAFYFAGLFGGRQKQLVARKLPAVASQRITPFADRILGYDGMDVVCWSATGTELWRYAVGSGAAFHASDSHVVVWQGANLHILDRNGKATYSDRMDSDVLFARAGNRRVAVNFGKATDSQLKVLSMTGTVQDSAETYIANRIVFDMGFFENDSKMWYTTMDVTNVIPVTRLSSIDVGHDPYRDGYNGEEIIYKVIYSNQLLHAVTTKEVLLFDYSIQPQRQNERRLVYGWNLIDWVAGSQDALMLFAPSFQTELDQSMTELRVLQGGTNRRFTLPAPCVGAWLHQNKVYAVSGDALYRTELRGQRFSAVKLPGSIEGHVTGFLGTLSGGVALLTQGQDVYAVTMP